MPGIVLNALFLTSGSSQPLWGRHYLNLFCKLSRGGRWLARSPWLASLSARLPTSEEGSEPTLWPPHHSPQTRGSAVRVYMELSHFCVLREEFSLWIFIQRKSFTLIDNLNTQQSYLLTSLSLANSTSPATEKAPGKPNSLQPCLFKGRFGAVEQVKLLLEERAISLPDGGSVGGRSRDRDGEMSRIAHPDRWTQPKSSAGRSLVTLTQLLFRIF